jgi:hypothetical protein
MGRRNKERIERIKAGLGKPFRNISRSFMVRAVQGDPEAISELEDKVIRLSGISPKNVTPSNVAKACVMMKGLIRVQGVSAIQAQIQKRLPDEIRAVIIQGKDPFEFYWSIKDFRDVWTRLGWDEAVLRRMIDDVRS